jgi:membrane-bound lytic murein transglycosylase D
MFYAKYKYILIRLLQVVCAVCLCQTAYATIGIWDVLSSEFTINHEVMRPEVQAQIRWLVRHPGYIQTVCRQSQPYIYHIEVELKKHGLPGELALLPMLESAYNPFAYSRVGAAGLWQLMPRTGSELGLKQDWWYDARRSVGASTEAALTHLAYLRRIFNNNWALAIAAYDAGEGTIARAIRERSGRVAIMDFWKLRVPRETQIYVPRFLALAEVIQNPRRYGIVLPYIPYMPYFAEVDIGSPIDLNHAARLAGIPYTELIKLNPGFNRWIMSPNAPFSLLIPREKVQRFSQNLAHLQPSERVSWVKYAAKKNDSLYSIAMHHHTTVNLIKQFNQLKYDNIKPNQVLLVPTTKNTVPSPPMQYTSRPAMDAEITKEVHRVIHIVQAHDSITSIERKYDLSSAVIQQWNPSIDLTALRPGQQLMIWKTTIPKTYAVKNGDTLMGIARKQHISIRQILALNPGLQQYNVLRLGERIRIS